MDLFTRTPKELTADFINNKIEAHAIPAKLVLQVQRRLYAMKRWGKMKELSDACIDRLNKKGWAYLEGYGWVKKSMVPYMGLVKKGEKWLIGDAKKHQEFLTSEKRVT